MRQRLFWAVMTAVICASACTMEKFDSGLKTDCEGEERSELTVEICGTMSKASPEEVDEEKVNHLQVFVFRGDIIDAYASSDTSKSVTLNCTMGPRTVYALVNAQDVNGAGIMTKAELLGTVSKLPDNGISNFVMIGSKDVTLPAYQFLQIEVEHLVARIALRGITVDFESSVYDSESLTVKEIFIENVAGDTNFGLTTEPTQWYNKQGYTQNLPELTHDDVDITIDDGTYSDVDYLYYAYPNKSNDSTDDEWSPRRTRLVLKVSFKDNLFYYPITLPALEANKSYEIDNVTITRLGSTDPDKPVETGDYNFEVLVKSWDFVPVTEGTTI